MGNRSKGEMSVTGNRRIGDVRSPTDKHETARSTNCNHSECNRFVHKSSAEDNVDSASSSSSVSSLSFYEDFPKLFFAVRKGRYVNGAVYVSWDMARKQIIDYPEAEYIATPTLLQAQKYVNGFGEYRHLGGEETEQTEQQALPKSTRLKSSCLSPGRSSGPLKNPPSSLQETNGATSASKANMLSQGHKHHSSGATAITATSTLASVLTTRIGKKKINSKDTDRAKITRGKKERFGSKTRRLLQEYYQLCIDARKSRDPEGDEPIREAQDENHPLPSVAGFLKERNMYKRKYKVFVKHWQRSGLLVYNHEGKSWEDASYQYDTWIEERYGSRFCDNMEDEKQDSRRTQGQKRQRPVAMPEGGSRNTDSKDDDDDDDDDESSGNSKTRDSTMVASYRKASPATSHAKSKKRPNPPSPFRMAKKKQKKVNASAVAAAAAERVAIPETVLATATIAPGHNRGAVGNVDIDIHEEDDDYDEHWSHWYQKLKTFHAQHGHCKVSKAVDPNLHYWVQYNHRRMRSEFARGGARSLTLREEKLLNDLDFNPVYKKIVTEFNKYLGMRVAKLFDVVKDSTDDSSTSSSNGESFTVEEGGETKKKRIKTKPFFGTVGRISSVSNQYLRVQYDDGDSEDFDKTCLLEGLKLYQSYKHQDPLANGVTTTTSVSNVAANVATTNAPSDSSNEKIDSHVIRINSLRKDGDSNRSVQPDGREEKSSNDVHQATEPTEGSTHERTRTEDNEECNGVPNNENGDTQKSVAISSETRGESCFNDNHNNHNHNHNHNNNKKKKKKIPNTTTSSSFSKISGECAICLEIYKSGDRVVRSEDKSRCPHVFHKECLVEYLAVNKQKHNDPEQQRKDREAPPKCPICRQPFCVLLAPPPKRHRSRSSSTRGRSRKS